MKSIKAFTIVELIVVITILAILGTIGFISFSSHLVGTRDTNRLSQLSTIYEGLEVYSANNTLPNPENSVEVRASGSLIGYQGYAGKNVLGMIQYSKGGKDPRDELYYSYYLTEDKKHFQLMGFLEDESNKQVSLITKTYATDYTRRYPTVIGKKLGILTESGTNSPIQEVSTIVSSGYLDVVTTTKDYKANFTDQDSLSGTGYLLSGLEKHILGGGKLVSSCNELLTTTPSLKGQDGNYLINPTGENIFLVYCDMTSDGGGWTLILHGTDNDIGLYDVRGNSLWLTGISNISFIDINKSFKFSDQIIGVIRNNSSIGYRIIGKNNSGTKVYYTKISCSYDHNIGNNGECSKLYYDINYVNHTGCLGNSGRKGIGCRPNGIITNHHNTNNIVCYNNSGGRCTNNSEGISVKLFIK